MAEFDDADALVAARRAGRARRATARMDAYTPFPVEGLAEALGFQRTRAAAGRADRRPGRLRRRLSACSTTARRSDYPLNVGGRPLNSWPAFIPITFELTILVASLAAVFGMLALNGLPLPYHPVFNVPRFALASQRPLLPVHRGDRPEVRPRGDAAVPGRAAARARWRRCRIER